MVYSPSKHVQTTTTTNLFSGSIFKHMGKVVIKILQGNVITKTMLDGLTVCPPAVANFSVPKIMKVGWQRTKLQ